MSLKQVRKWNQLMRQSMRDQSKNKVLEVVFDIWVSKFAENHSTSTIKCPKTTRTPKFRRIAATRFAAFTMHTGEHWWEENEGGNGRWIGYPIIAKKNIGNKNPVDISKVLITQKMSCILDNCNLFIVGGSRSNSGCAVEVWKWNRLIHVFSRPNSHWTAADWWSKVENCLLWDTLKYTFFVDIKVTAKRY